MKTNDKAAFTPTLTVAVDYGDAPFLWLADSPEDIGIGELIGSGYYCDDEAPLSEALWRKFADWAIAFDHTEFYSKKFNADNWDWMAYHARGLQLSRKLKEEVGNSYRVIYWKPCEDPNSSSATRVACLQTEAVWSASAAPEKAGMLRSLTWETKPRPHPKLCGQLRAAPRKGSKSSRYLYREKQNRTRVRLWYGRRNCGTCHPC